MAKKAKTETSVFTRVEPKKRPGQHSKNRPPAKAYRGQGR